MSETWSHINAKVWDSHKAPKKILIIRFHAFGDVLITLPYIVALREKYPSTQFDFLTLEEWASVPESLKIFGEVVTIKSGRSVFLKVGLSLLKIPYLMSLGYDGIIDLQNNYITKILRRALFPTAWAEFDKFSPNTAGSRTKKTFEAFGNIKLFNSFSKIDQINVGGLKLLKEEGWSQEMIVVLNPAGYFETRNWPLTNYVSFAKLWLGHTATIKFVILGINSLMKKAEFLESELGDSCINLVGKTTPAQAFEIVKESNLVLSEDSGLMHMSWINGVPTVALFGSTRSDWSRPLGEHSYYLDSSDLECGNCMLANCIWGDVRCLKRYTPEFLFSESLNLLKRNKKI